VASSNDEAPQPLGPIPSLDGIRAVAVSLVFFAHGGLEKLVPGGLGVTIFFVLSGFLITTLMRTEHARSGRVDFRNFYLRRLLRLMPPLLLVLGAAGLLSLLSIIDGGFSSGGLLAAVFYAGNYFVIAHDFQGLPAGIGVVWSLAIEEHFYLLFPPLAAVLLRTGRPGWSIGTFCALCAGILLWRVWLVMHGTSAAYLTMATDTRVDAILFGCGMALVCNPWLDRVAAPNAFRDGAIAAVSLAVLVISLTYRDEAFRLTARYTLQSVAVAALIYLAVARAHKLPFRWLNARPVAYIGTVSYAIYLSHHMILLGLARHWPLWPWWQLTLAGVLLTLAFVESVRRWVEQPLGRLRRSLRTTSPVSKVAATVLSVSPG
jgi:peptidoglycan/LPS O-acetylase OafA/YrhL